MADGYGVRGAAVNPLAACACVAAITGASMCACPPAAADTYGLPECEQALPGSAVEAAAQAHGIPIVCEARPAGAPSYTTGEWDGTTIRLWVTGQDPRVVRKVAGHELAHWEGDADGHVAEWSSVRGVTGQTAREDYAEMFSRVNFYEAGVGYTFYAGPLTEQQTDLMRSWWTGQEVITAPATEPAVVELPPSPVQVPASPSPSSVPPALLDAAPPEPAQVSTLTAAPPVVVAFPNVRMVAVLHALREVA